MKLPPSLAVAREVARAFWDVCKLPLRLQDYLTRHDALQNAVRADLHAEPAKPSCAEPHACPDRPLRIFVSCAEASGEIHAVHMVEQLRRRAKELGGREPEFIGLGGAALERAGVRLLGRPVDRAAMGIGGVLPLLPYYIRLLTSCARELKEGSIDLFLPIDSPALHVPIAHMARHYGVRVVHFVAPQYWGWAPWRVSSYKRAVDLALTILPFEPRWFAREQVATRHVGHPLLDALSDVPASRPDAERCTLAILPGSRRSVIRANLPWMLKLAGFVQRRHPELELEILQGSEAHRELVEDLVQRSSTRSTRVVFGALHDRLASARAALSVSGTVLIDLLHHRLPTVVLYRLEGRRGTWMYENLLTAPYFASVNLLAGRELLPELCFHGDGPLDEADSLLERALFHEDWRRDCVVGLDQASSRLGPPGAVERAASHALAVAAGVSSPL